MKIKYVIELFVSKRDVNGNKYYAFNMWNTETGQRLCGTIDNDRAPENAIWHKASEPGEILKFQQELNKKEFKFRTKGSKHYLQNEIHIEINEGRI
jgi:hypothetical protein